MSEEFNAMNAISDWAESRSVDIKFFRNEYDGWMWEISFKDSRGTFSKCGNVPKSKPTKQKEEDWVKSITKTMSNSCVEARKNRAVEAWE